MAEAIIINKDKVVNFISEFIFSALENAHNAVPLSAIIVHAERCFPLAVIIVDLRFCLHYNLLWANQ